MNVVGFGRIGAFKGLRLDEITKGVSVVREERQGLSPGVSNTKRRKPHRSLRKNSQWCGGQTRGQVYGSHVWKAHGGEASK